MPRALIAGHELQYPAVSANEEVRRDAQAAQAVEVRVRCMVETVGEEALDLIATVPPRRQADRMHHDQGHAFNTRPFAEIG
jgi:hypothetical protein